MRYTIITIVFISALFSCQKKDALSKSEKHDKVITMNSISNYDSIVNLVKIKGDTLAYDELFFYLMDSNEKDRTDTVMYYSKMMAEKYDYKEAYKRYFNAFSEKYKINMDVDNYSTLNMSSLKKAQKKQAEDWLGKMLEKKIITQEQYNSINK